ncbi:TetR/AcrR family transcriptional regulator C-terminal domain-containing protein [Actinoallomurus soli]|uniref:TetR/AcrR family transcriptional regulator C-terminal domain-containing protein n=1 Tax=Actinoallomurus soli TaxID=2952535 RepID=UPI00209229C1|nr:TetR/AcrR family transcriptional regulator C-terminal domain-containing protein [Actinoallomurus soli]MCO5969273.1 TetR/AcrR family transcriptional regulator [Actinoallomurus soli]
MTIDGDRPSAVPERYQRAGDRKRAADPVWSRPRGGRRPKLSREAIVAAAITIADAEGLDAVSIRRVASELGVRAMSLYTHIDAKEDLLDLMYDEVAAEVLIEGELPGDWREAFRWIAAREREAGLRHPWVFQLAGRSPRVGPNGLLHAEQSFAAASRLTDDPRAMRAIVTAIDHYLLGYTLRAQHNREREAAGLGGIEEQPYVRSLLAEGRFPHLKPVLDAGIPAQEDFEQGLTWILDGIEREYGQSR